MGKMFTIFKREISSYFKSPLAYVLISVFLSISGYVFITYILFTKLSYMQPIFQNMITLMIFISPILTMGLLTEERRQGIDQLLFTSPLKIGEFVLAKFLAAYFVYLIILILTFLYPLTIEYFGNIDYGPILSAYVGLFLVGAVFISIGVFASSLTQSQVIAGIISFGILIFIWILSYLKSVFSGEIAKFIHNIDLFAHYIDFQKGVIDTKSIVFYLSITFIFLFLTTRVIDKRRWS